MYISALFNNAQVVTYISTNLSLEALGERKLRPTVIAIIVFTIIAKLELYELFYHLELHEL